MKPILPEEEESRRSNSRIARNTLMLYVRQLVVLLIGLYTSRALLAALGVTDYGLYNVVGGVVTMLGFLNGAMIGATQRFLAVDLGRRDEAHLRITFSATRYLHMVLVCPPLPDHPAGAYGGGALGLPLRRALLHGDDRTGTLQCPHRGG